MSDTPIFDSVKFETTVTRAKESGRALAQAFKLIGSTFEAFAEGINEIINEEVPDDAAPGE